MNRRFFAFFLILLLAACAPLAPAAPTLPPTAIPTAIPPTSTTAPTVAPSPTVVELNLDQLKNATYTLIATNNVPVKLVDGKLNFSDPANNLKVVGQLIEPPAFGDLNGDGLTDAVLIIAANTGGSGTFHELIVVLAQKGQAADLLVGDRIQEKQLTIQDGKIILEYLRAGKNDPLCCPSEHAKTTYQFQNGKLTVLTDQVIP